MFVPKARKTKIVFAFLTALIVAVSGVFVVFSTETDGQYEKLTTYAADLEGGITNEDSDWDLLFDAQISGGKIYGSSSSESGVFGVGFRHRLPGRGVSSLSACVKIPEGKKGFVKFGLRLGDYYDMSGEKKGIFICVSGDGQLGVVNAGGKIVTARDTGVSFFEGRKIYIDDDADANVITVSFDDGGRKVNIAKCMIDGQNAALRFEDESIAAVEINYGFDIYKGGYISITTPVTGVNISDLSVTVPSFSSEPYRDPAAADEEKEANTNKSTNKNTGDLIIYPIAGAAMIAVIIIVSIELVKTRKKQ